MKNTIKWFGVIALIAVIGFSMAACGGGDDPFIPLPPGGGGDISYTVEAKGTPTERIKFYFKGAVTDLQESDITVTDGTGAVTVDFLSDLYPDSGPSHDWMYDLYVTPTQSGTVKIQVTKSGIKAGEKTVTVKK